MRGAPTIVTMELPLPYGQEGLWFPEFNIVALAPHLDAEGRERALDEVQIRWRQALRPELAGDAPNFAA